MPEQAPTTTLRQADGRDRPALEALMGSSFDANDAEGATTVLDDPRFGTGAFSVVEEAGQIVSAMALLSMDLHVRHGDTEVTIPTGQPEYVATADSHRGRGLVARQMRHHHALSEERGDLLQIIGGIPYYYRRFGYGWGIAMPGAWRLRSNNVPPVDGAIVRDLREDDLNRVAALDADLRRRADVFNTRSEAEWRAMLQLANQEQCLWAVERGGNVTGHALCHLTSEGHARLSDVTAVDVADVHALVRHALDAGNQDVTVIDRPRTVVEPWARSYAVSAAEAVYAWYVRIPDPVALLDHLRPVLTARLRASPLAAWSGDVRFTTYTDGFVLHVEHGQVTRVEPASAQSDPGPDVVGVAPDQLPGLVFGRLDPLSLEDRHPDVRLRHHAGTCAILFPRQVAQVNLWF